jgi:ankyrin repeat protein
MKNEALIEAVKKGEVGNVAALLDEDRSLLTSREGNVTAILLALYHGHPEICQAFVARGARLSFAEACALGDQRRALELLEKDPSLIHSYSDDGFPPAGLAIFFRKPALARTLIERGADVNAAARNPQRVAPVHAAAAVRDHETMKLLLERGADPNARQQFGFTAFHAAASRGDIEMAKLLLQHGADPKMRTDDGKDAGDIADKYSQPAFADWFRASMK